MSAIEPERLTAATSRRLLALRTSCTTGGFLPLRISQQAAGQVEGGGVGEHLVKVYVGNPLVLNTFVLGVADERACVAVPPGEVWSETDPRAGRNHLVLPLS